MKYTKLLLTTLLIIGFSLNSFPQKESGSHNDYRWEIGLNGGVNLTSVQGFDHNNIDQRFGQLYGATLIYHFSRYVSLKTDIDFENKGWTLNNYTTNVQDLNGDIQSITANLNQDLDYFDVPMFLHIGFGNKFKFDLNFGTYFAFLLENRTYYNDPNGIEVDVIVDELSGYNNFDFGLTYGGGIDYAISNRVSIGFDVLYEQGLTSLQADSDIKNRSLDFDIGINYLFHKKKK